MTAATVATDSNVMPRADDNEVIDGINLILSMLEIIGQPVFPRNIMTGDYTGFFTVYDTGQLFDAFKRAKFRECRISAYPPISKNNMLIPNLLLLDLDYDQKLVISNGKLYADRILKIKVNKILKNLQLTYHITSFMVMHTGNGRHVLIPFLFDVPLDNLIELRPYLPLIHKYRKNLDNIVSEEFLSFSKNYLSNNQADTANHPNFASIFLRVPGTLNMKMKYGIVKIVKIEHTWNYEDIGSIPTFGDLHPDTNLFYDFMHHLALTAGDNLESKLLKNIKRKSNRSNWIEILYNTAVSDCRKRIIWLILTRYAINIRKMTHEEAFTWIKQWADRCDSVTKFDSNYNIDERIDYYLDLAEDTGYFPPSFSRLESYQWKMTGGIDLYDLIRNKMSRK
jgi:hypothetical protein